MIHTNAQHKDGKYFVAELDESDGTIVKYSPDILVINNLEADHLDFYKNGLEDLVKTFNTAVSRAKKVLINADNEGVNLLSGNFVTFGLNKADYTAQNIKYEKIGTTFDIFYKDKLLVNIFTPLSGVHNVYNNLAVVAALNETGVGVNVGVNAGVGVNDLKPYFGTFTGMGRRFQKVLEFDGIEVYDES